MWQQKFQNYKKSLLTDFFFQNKQNKGTAGTYLACEEIKFKGVVLIRWIIWTKKA